MTQNSQPKYQLLGPPNHAGRRDVLDDQNQDDAFLRMQALTTEWLRMDNLVVLTGAGTSVSSGGRTIVDLETNVLNTVLQIPGIPASISSILNARLENSGPSEDADTISFEDWLSYLVNAHFLCTTDASPITSTNWDDCQAPTDSELTWAIKWISRSIYAECALILKREELTTTTSSLPPHLGFLAKIIARDSTLGRTHLFTLNYDTLFEQALEYLGIQYFDGFAGSADSRFDPSVYGLDLYYPGEVTEGRVRRFDKFLHLYKLHGSIHWREFPDEIRARHPDLTHFEDYSSLDHSQKAAKLGELTAHIPSYGILPTANKFVQTLNMPFANLFRLLQLRLSVPQTFLLVLGYGFGDEHVTRILETALTNPSLVMLIVEPNPNSDIVGRVNRYQDIGNRAFVLTVDSETFGNSAYRYATFDDFSRNVLPDVRWLEDFLRLRRFEDQILRSNPSGISVASDQEGVS